VLAQGAGTFVNAAFARVLSRGGVWVLPRGFAGGVSGFCPGVCQGFCARLRRFVLMDIFLEKPLEAEKLYAIIIGIFIAPPYPKNVYVIAKHL
jgi:hypothetical protein